VSFANGFVLFAFGLTAKMSAEVTVTLSKDSWSREGLDTTRRQLRMTADFCSIYFNDGTALLGLITMEPVIQSRHCFLIYDQGHILSNYI
jgi:hypothetical protein